ncbi:MAG: zinc-binding dehydrogenase [Chitinophagales bacterium]|nr:zinc-binding dehydrogenase [Chitinophagales bacterium]MDW8418695.1 zinc-binding dehydrogenase [Chitinophagales bacterium]
MKALYLVEHGSADKAFSLRETTKPVPKAGEVLIEVEGFGLNFADIMARKGQYRDAPPPPCIIGYDVVGRVVRKGAGVKDFAEGERVTAMTRFGGYAQYVVTDARAVTRVQEQTDITEAAALTTQYCTAYYCAAEMVHLHEGDTVVIHSAAGGVGSALLQYALHKKCRVIATTGSDTKVAMLQAAGAEHVINTSKEDFDEALMRITKGEGADVIFDAVGANQMRQGFQCLAAGGRIVCYGAAALNDANNIFSQVISGLQFGIYHPAELMMNSKSMIGVNMLRIADKKPQILKRCLDNVVRLYHEGVFKPQRGRVFKADQIAQAHHLLETRQTTGKVVCVWS